MSRIEFKPKRLGMRVFTNSTMRETAVSGFFGRNEVEVAVAGRRPEIAHCALVDAMGVDDDPAGGGLSKHLC